MLVHMMKVMHQHGCLDSTLTQQIKQLLSDAALQDYTAAFTPVNDSTNRSTPDLTCSVSLSSASKQHQNGSISEVRWKKDGKNASHTASESTTNLQDSSSEITTAPRGIVKKNANSTVPVSPVQEHTSVSVSPSPEVPLKDALSTNTTQVRIQTIIIIHISSLLLNSVVMF